MKRKEVAYSVGKELESPLAFELGNVAKDLVLANEKTAEANKGNGGNGSENGKSEAVPEMATPVSAAPAPVEPAKFVETQPIQEVKPAANTAGLNEILNFDPSKIGVITVSDDQIKAEAEKIKHLAEELGPKKAKIVARINQLEADSNIEFSPSAKKELAQLKADLLTLEDLLKKDDAFRGHAEFTALIAEIKAVNPEALAGVREMWSCVHKQGLRKLVNKDEWKSSEIPKGQGPVFFEGQISIPVSGTAGQRALEAELRKLVDGAKTCRASSLKARGKTDIANLVCEKARRADTYYRGASKPERHLLLRLKDRNVGKKNLQPYWVVEVLDSDGSCSWIRTQEGRRDVPLYWIERNFISLPKDEQGNPRYLKPGEFSRALHLIRTIREMVELNGHPFPESSRKKTETKSSPPSATSEKPAKEESLPAEPVTT